MGVGVRDFRICTEANQNPRTIIVIIIIIIIEECCVLYPKKKKKNPAHDTIILYCIYNLITNVTTWRKQKATGWRDLCATAVIPSRC